VECEQLPTQSWMMLDALQNVLATRPGPTNQAQFTLRVLHPECVEGVEQVTMVLAWIEGGHCEVWLLRIVAHL